MIMKLNTNLASHLLMNVQRVGRLQNVDKKKKNPKNLQQLGGKTLFQKKL